MKKIIINGINNNPVEYEWRGSLVATLRSLNEWLDEEDATGYFFEVENADKGYLKGLNVPIFMNAYGRLIAPTDCTIVEEVIFEEVI